MTKIWWEHQILVMKYCNSGLINSRLLWRIDVLPTLFFYYPTWPQDSSNSIDVGVLTLFTKNRNFFQSSMLILKIYVRRVMKGLFSFLLFLKYPLFYYLYRFWEVFWEDPILGVIFRFILNEIKKNFGLKKKSIVDILVCKLKFSSL